jgi:hypothetical protein
MSLAVLFGCGDPPETARTDEAVSEAADRNGGRAAVEGEAEAAAGAAEAGAEPAASEGLGVLTLAGTDYPFEVDACTLLGDLGSTVMGHGDAGGEPYEVVIVLTYPGRPQALEGVNLTFESGRRLVGNVAPNYPESDGSRIEVSDRIVRSTRPIELRSESGDEVHDATVEVDCS